MIEIAQVSIFTYKFYIANQVYTSSNQIGTDLSKIYDIQCSVHYPTCYYNFTTQSHNFEYFCFKVASPVVIIHNYFGEDDVTAPNGGIYKKKQILTPKIDMEVKNTDSDVFLDEKFMISGIVVDIEETENEEWCSQYYQPDDELLLNRQTHLWAYKYFEERFRQMFIDCKDSLFQTPLMSLRYNSTLECDNVIEDFLDQAINNSETIKSPILNETVSVYYTEEDKSSDYSDVSYPLNII